MQLRAPLWLFSQTKVEAPWWLFSFFSNLHQYDFSLEQNGKFIGGNVIMVLTFFFSESYRGSRGLPLVFLDCFMYLFHFRISGVATYEPSLGPFLGSKEKKPLNPHISKSLLAPIWLSPRTLQRGPWHTVSCEKPTYENCVSDRTLGSTKGLELHKRLDFIETNWPYFLGFGLPLAAITSYFPSVVVSG